MTAEEATRLHPDFAGLPPTEQQKILDILTQEEHPVRTSAYERPAPPPMTIPGATRTLEMLPQAAQRFIAPRARRPGEETGMGATLGEAVGTGMGIMAASATGGTGAVLIPLAASVGAMGGKTLESYLITGKAPNWKDVAIEGVLSAAPEVAESGLKAGGRFLQQRVLRSTTGGRVLRQAEQYRRAHVAAQRAYNAPSQAAVDAAFQKVHTSGRMLDTTPLVAKVQKLPSDALDTLRSEIERADAVINQRLNTTGARDFTTAYDEVLKAAFPPQTPRQQAGFLAQPQSIPLPPVPPQMDISDVQNLRSALRQRRESVTNPVTKDLLQNFQDDLDTMVTQALTPKDSDTAEVAATLLKAREGYARLMASNNLSDFFLDHSRVIGSRRVLQLDSALDALEKQRGKLAQRVNASLNTHPQALQNFNILVDRLRPLTKELEFVGMTPTTVKETVPFFGGMIDGLSESLLSKPALEALVNGALQEGGKITPNLMAYAVNIARRDPTLAEQMPPPIPQAAQAVRDLLPQTPSQ